MNFIPPRNDPFKHQKRIGGPCDEQYEYHRITEAEIAEEVRKLGIRNPFIKPAEAPCPAGITADYLVRVCQCGGGSGQRCHKPTETPTAIQVKAPKKLSRGNP